MLKRRFFFWYTITLFLSASIFILSPSHSASGWAQDCDASCPQVYSCCWGVSDIAFKSLLPALIELDPYTLKIKDENSYWELDASPFMEGLSGSGSASDPELFLLSAANDAGTSTIYRWDFDLHTPVPYLDLEFEALSLAHKGSNFYVIGPSGISRLGGATVPAPTAASGLSYMTDPEGDYLLVVTRNNFSEVYRIDLVNGEPTGTPSLIAPFNASADTGRYSALSYARIVWEDGIERDVLYVTKDDFLTLPCDTAMIIDFRTGDVLKLVRAAHSGVRPASPYVSEEGTAFAYINWANPQGIVYIDGRLFLLSRYRWNAGPLQPSCYSYEFKAYLNGREAETLPSAVEVNEGDSLTLRYEVRNNGVSPITWKTLTDTGLGDLTGSCLLPKTVFPGETASCEIAGAADPAPEGKVHVGKITVDCLPDQIKQAWYKTAGSPSGTTLSAVTTAEGSLRKRVEYDWKLRKTVTPSRLTMASGASGTVTYTLKATRTKISETTEPRVAGESCVTNSGTAATEDLKIVVQVQYKTSTTPFTDLPGASQTELPSQKLVAGETTCYPFEIGFRPMSGAEYSIVAKVTATNLSGHLGEEYGPEQLAGFNLPGELAEPIEVDAVADVTDVPLCPEGLICITDTPGTWKFTNSGSVQFAVEIQNGLALCNSTVLLSNTAILLEEHSQEQRPASASAKISIGPCPAPNCTRTIGYWKNHPERITPLLPVSLGTGAGKSLLVTDASQAVNVLKMKVYGSSSNGITKLYAQLLAAKLNIANGSDSAAVASTLTSADSFLVNSNWQDWSALNAEQTRGVLGWKTMLDRYNNGVIGPGHCTE
jgi:hypothetical protein